MAGSLALGKLTLNCDEDFDPECFEFLRVLCDMTKALLEASLKWDQEFHDKTKWMEENAELILGDTCHHVATNLAGFPLLLSHYKQVSGDNRELHALNVEFKSLYDHVNTMLKETRDRLLRPVARKRRADLMQVVRSAFTGSFPAVEGHFEHCPPDLEMDLDGPPFESALLEMIHNSRQCFTAATQLRIDVAVRILLRPGQEKVRIEFADNGPGIPQKYKGRIFDQFFSRRPHGERGTGVGLFFVRRVVRAHGGSIREVGEPGVGARFLIDLPRYDRVEAKE